MCRFGSTPKIGKDAGKEETPMWKLVAGLSLLALPVFAVSAPVMPKCQFVNGVPAASSYVDTLTTTGAGTVTSFTVPAGPTGGNVLAIPNASNPFVFRPSTDGACPASIPANVTNGTGMSIGSGARYLRALSSAAINMVCVASASANTIFSVEYCEQ